MRHIARCITRRTAVFGFGFGHQHSPFLPSLYCFLLGKGQGGSSEDDDFYDALPNI
jgi:hypothetical protein